MFINAMKRVAEEQGISPGEAYARSNASRRKHKRRVKPEKIKRDNFPNITLYELYFRRPME